MSHSVLVLGGGIIGLSCAYELAKKGVSVTVIEPKKIGGQASGAAAGMLAPYSELLDQPDAFFRLCIESLQLFPDWTKEIEKLSGLSVYLQRSGSLYICRHEADLLPLQTRMLWQNQYGAKSELMDRHEIHKLEPALSSEVIAALYCETECHVDAPKLVMALEACCRLLNVTIRSNTGEVTGLQNSGNGVEVSLANGQERITAERAIICSGAWSSCFEQQLGISLPIHPIRGQICSYEPTQLSINHLIFSAHAYWAGKSDRRLICGASEDVAGFTAETTPKGIDRLLRASSKWLPELAHEKIMSSWAGIRPATKDGYPFIGFASEDRRILAACGHYRNGILLSPVTGQIIAQLVEQDTDVDKMRNISSFFDYNAFDPRRFS